MQNQIIIPDNEAHWLELKTKDVTSTEISALYGLNPYMTEFELWHRKKENITVDFLMHERVEWGMYLEDSIAKKLAVDNKWQIRNMDEYIRIPELRLAASFDFSIEGENLGLLEVKNVDSLIYRDKWIIDGDNVEAPPHIEFQCYCQMLVSNRKFAYIGALIGGNRAVLIRREADQEIFDSMIAKVKAFWKSIDENIPPEPDFSKDAKTISKLYGYSEPGKIYSAEGDLEILTLATRYKELGEAVKACDIERDGIKSQLLIKVGDSEKVIGDGFSISAGMIGPARIEYDRQGYRTFRINWKREKK